ncbi:MAG TPA: MotA/TolQ/ExbB proton channel family protein [Planctomycetota bacterium]|nr:MotA/TolQ/ExbB proton channel family protein [Planctomycetota bacterium]
MQLPVLLADETLWDMLSKTLNESGGVEKAVFYLLIGFSLVSWSIIFWKLFTFYEAKRNTKRFLSVFDGAESFGEAMAHGSGTGQSPVLAVFKGAMYALDNKGASNSVPADARGIKINPGATREEVVTISMQHTARDYFSKMQYGLGFLATAGSATPFIGLFGTVWGILNTFRHIGIADKNSLASVGAGISSALIATAAGLAVAIPAVIAYNAFLAACDSMQEKTERFIERVMMLVRGSGCIHELPGAKPAAMISAHIPSPASSAPVGTSLPASQVKTHVTGAPQTV